ncbi:hypothetical protein SAMN05446589_8450 [Streptomyces sp. OV198]|nr:hypothetical protein SAMN05446589_8450 [Streptomyces sp. OV198]
MGERGVIRSSVAVRHLSVAMVAAGRLPHDLPGDSWNVVLE